MARILIFLPIICVLFTGCFGTDSPFVYTTVRGDGNIRTIERDVGHFTSLRITGSHTSVVYGDREGPLRITGEENILQHLDIYIDNDRLVITSKGNVNLRPSQRVEIEIPAKHLTKVRVSGSNRIELLHIDRDYFHIHGSGSTRVIADGYVGDLEVRMSGSSRLDAVHLITENANVRTSGTSRAEIHTEDILEARSSGSSRIRYYGNPIEVTAQSSGSSSVRAAK